ncbi:MAG: nicotinate (nicotinamide) nucleotide adenylyltransferase [Clostridia bacterium]|nr:nicotinate (nicotinamide) nucleotide adenylyltransferase [Clostridia bacterium]
MPVTAIFGGTFNPFHIGHYEMLSALQADESINKILVLPDKIPPHKKCDFMASDAVRIEMCRLAASDFPKAELCLLEFEREGKSYTYDTVLLLQEKYPGESFAFVCGGDMLVYFDKWYNYKELMKLLPFVVFRRSDTDNTLFDECVARFTEMGMNITVKDEIITAVSSTDIRKDFSCSKRFLPEKIHAFLSERGEY